MSNINNLENIKRKYQKVTDEQIKTLIESELVPVEKRIVKKSEILNEAYKEQEALKRISDYYKKELSKYGISARGYETDLFYESVCERINLDWPGVIGSDYTWWNRHVESIEYMRKMESKLNVFYQQAQNELKGLKKGEEGERRLSQELTMYRGKYYYRENVLIPADDIGGETSETDVYIVTSKGIFGCEVKNWGKKGQTIVISKDGQWKIETGRGQYKIIEHSPVGQNARHCLATERFLEKNGLSRDHYKVIPLVIIANNDVQMRNYSDNSVIRISEIYNFIERYKSPVHLTQEQQEKVLAAFDNCEVSERAFPILSISRNEQIIKEHIHSICEWYKDECTWKEAVAQAYYKQCNKQAKKNGALAFISTLIAIFFLWKDIPAIRRTLQVKLAFEPVIPSLLWKAFVLLCVGIAIWTIWHDFNVMRQKKFRKKLIIFFSVCMLCSNIPLHKNVTKYATLNGRDYITYTVGGKNGEGWIHADVDRELLKRDYKLVSSKLIVDYNELQPEVFVPNNNGQLSNGDEVYIGWGYHKKYSRDKCKVLFDRTPLKVIIDGLDEE